MAHWTLNHAKVTVFDSKIKALWNCFHFKIFGENFSLKKCFKRGQLESFYIWFYLIGHCCQIYLGNLAVVSKMRLNNEYSQLERKNLDFHKRQKFFSKRHVILGILESYIYQGTSYILSGAPIFWKAL